MLQQCRKAEAPDIDLAVGRYNISGSFYYDTTLTKTVADTILTVTKVDNNTLGFVIAGCTNIFYTANFTYGGQAGQSTM